MNNWNELSVRERAKYIRDYVALGYRKLNDIVDDYNSFKGGGIVGKLHNYSQKAKERIELNYNRPLSNGSWITRHQQKWYDFLTSHGYKPIDAVRLSGFFAAQDAFETGGGTSDAARTKNNFGGMLRGGKNITYRDTNEYMTAKLRMMLRTFPDAMNALTIDEYATLLGDPTRAAKGHSLYYVTDKINFNANDPLWILLQTNHMHNYINGMRMYAGMKSINFNDPESLALYTGYGNILSDELLLYLVPQLILDLVALNSLLTPYALLELQPLEKLNLPKEESNETTTQSTNDYMLPLFMILNATQPIVALLLPLTSVLQSSLLPSLELLLYGNFFDGGGEMTRVRRANGEYAFVKTKDGHAITDGTGRYPLYNSSGTVIGTGIGDSFPYVGNVKDEGFLDEVTVTPQSVTSTLEPIDWAKESSNLFQNRVQAERNKEIARNKAVDAKVSQYAFTPEGFFDVVTRPAFTLLSPANTGRALYNIATGNGEGNIAQQLFSYNNGVFSDEFAREHPYWTMAGNMLTDALAYGTGAALWKMPKYRAALQAENRAAQEAVANQWDNMISRGTSTQAPSASTANPGSMVLFERPTGNLSVRERLGLPKGSKVYTDVENQQFLNQINDFAGKYGYQGLEEGTYTAEELEAYARALIDRHNKFYRGVTMPTNEKDIANIKSVLGENATDDEILQYVATHPREGYLVRTPEENGVNWLTPNKEQASIFGDTQNGKTAMVSRQYKLGNDRTKWFDEGDYTMTGGANWHLGMGDLHEPYTEFVTLDGRRLTTSLPARPRYNRVTEVVSDKPTVFRGWANESNPDFLSGKYPEVPVEYWQQIHPRFLNTTGEGWLQQTADRLGINVNHYYNTVITPEELSAIAANSHIPITEEFLSAPRYIGSGFPYGLDKSRLLMPYDKIREMPMMAKYKNLSPEEFKKTVDNLIGSHEFIHWWNQQLRKNLNSGKMPVPKNYQKQDLTWLGPNQAPGMSSKEMGLLEDYFTAANATETNARAGQLFNAFGLKLGEFKPAHIDAAKKHYTSVFPDNDMTTFLNAIVNPDAFSLWMNENAGVLFSNGGKLLSSPLTGTAATLYGNSNSDSFTNGEHLYYTGGPIKNPLFMPELDNQLLWPALNSVDFKVYPDNNFDINGAHIETMVPLQVEDIWSDSKYGFTANRVLDLNGNVVLVNPNYGGNSITYNPSYVNNDVIALDALHIMTLNEVYNQARQDFIDNITGDTLLLGIYDLTGNEELSMQIAKKYFDGLKLTPEEQEILLPAIDGLIRNQLAPDYLRGEDVPNGYAERYKLSPKELKYMNNIQSILESTILPEVDVYPLYAKGGSIHINPKNKGKFSAAAKRAGMSTQQYASHVLANKDKYSSTLVKRANFAKNASKWKHDFGGPLIYGGHKGLIRV